jgi:hypothetical protein
MPHKHSSSHRKNPRETAPKHHRSYGASRNEAQSRNRDFPPKTSLTKLIEQDAPLFTHSQLVLMYGPFQTEMAPEAGQGVASWMKDCIRQYGLPSLVRFDYRRRAQIFRRDQFQPWLEPLMEQAC